MSFDDVKKYIAGVKDSDKFKKLNAFTHMADIEPEKDIYENIERYLIHCGKKQIGTWKLMRGENGTMIGTYEPDYKYFLDFLKHYFEDKPAEIVLSSRGLLDLDKSLYLEQPRRFLKGVGFFLDNKLIFTDGSVYFSKQPIYLKCDLGPYGEESMYAPLIASYIAKSLQIETPDFEMAIGVNGPRVLSRNFLKPNEEMLSYSDEQQEVTVSEQLKTLEDYLKSRRCSTHEIETAKLEFLKQEFVAKIIGLKDQKAENSPIVVTIDEQGGRHVRVAPMYDLDFSFHIAEQFDLIQRKCDNGKTDVSSLIEQYKDYPEFMDFVKCSVENLNMQEIFKRIYKDKGIDVFKDYKAKQEIRNYEEFVNKNIEMAKKTIGKFEEIERGE